MTAADVNGGASGRHAGAVRTHADDGGDNGPVEFLRKVSSRKGSMPYAYSADCGSIDELPSEIARVSGAVQPASPRSPRK